MEESEWTLHKYSRLLLPVREGKFLSTFSNHSLILNACKLKVREVICKVSFKTLSTNMKRKKSSLSAARILISGLIA